MNFDLNPFHVEIVLEKMSVGVYDKGMNLTTVETREPTTEERSELGTQAMEWFRSIGHLECNPSCAPPFRHTSQAAHDEREMFLQEYGK